MSTSGSSKNRKGHGPSPLAAANFAYDHPRGRIFGWFSPKGLRRLLLPRPDAAPLRLRVLHSSANDHRVWALHAALEQYFAGVCDGLGDIPLDLGEGTAFQQVVWRATAAVPWGETVTYGELARRIDRPRAARAVGQALGVNPVPILVPCHRIVGAMGLGGFGAGLPWKETFLHLEHSLS